MPDTLGIPETIRPGLSLEPSHCGMPDTLNVPEMMMPPTPAEPFHCETPLTAVPLCTVAKPSISPDVRRRANHCALAALDCATGTAPETFAPPEISALRPDWTIGSRVAKFP